MEQEVFVSHIQYAFRPNGQKAVVVDFFFESIFIEKRATTSPHEHVAQININSTGITPAIPEERKLTMFFSLEEWKEVEKKFTLGSTHIVKIDSKKRVILE